MVQVDKTKNIGGSLDIGGVDSGSSQPYMSATDRHFAAGGSIFNAPGVKQAVSSEPPKADSGSCSISGTNGAASNADGAAKKSNTDISASEKITDEIKPVPAQARAHVKLGETKINSNLTKVLDASNKGQQHSHKIEQLIVDRDNAQADVDSAPAGETTGATPHSAPTAPSSPADQTGIDPQSDGTGSGAKSALNISAIGADTPQQNDDNQEGLGKSNHRNVGPKMLLNAPAGNLIGNYGANAAPTTVTGTTPSSTTAPAPTAASTAQGAGGSGNADAQARVDALNGQLGAETAEQTQTSQQATSSVNQLKAAFNSQKAILQAQTAAMDEKLGNAASYEKASQVTALSGQTATTLGGTASAVGGLFMASSASFAATGNVPAATAAAATGKSFMIAGVAATGAGAGATVTAGGLKMHAENLKTSATNAKTEIAAQGKQLVSFYSKAVSKAVRAEKNAQGQNSLS